MAKKLAITASDSSLSPPPDNLESVVETTTVKVAVTSKKRKAESAERIAPRAKRPAAKKAVVEDVTDDEDAGAEATRSTKTTIKRTTTRKTKTKVVKTSEPLEQRTQGIKHRIGAHVSSAGGVHNAIVNLLYIGGNAFALFLKNQKRWESPPMDPEHARLFIEGCEKHGIDAGECCVPHGSYLVNLAHPDPERKKQAYDSFLGDLTRCHKLGIKLYNFHPGNANATTREEGIQLIAENLNRAHEDPASGDVITLLETMASLGNTIGGTFADIGAIINLVKNKKRVGVCLDTCHSFAAGYDLRTPEAYAATMDKFDQEIGLKYLKAFHINDSKAPLFSHRDLHANIGTGYLGLRSFHNLMNDERFRGLPMVLETPINIVGEDGKKGEDKGIWAREIKMLESLVGMDIESEQFIELEAKLQDEGKSERERIGGQVERSKAKKAAPKRKGKKKVETEDEDDSDE